MLIHIGYHKTGSTLLQKLLFSDADSQFVMYSGNRQRIHDAFVDCGPYAGADASIVAGIRSEREAAEADGRVLVLSHERLAGYPAEGGVDARLIADRLVEAFPDAKVLIGIREQVSLIASYYSQYITDGGGLALRHFLARPEPSLTRQHLFDLRYYEFHRAVAYYRSIFGAANVLVAPFEQLRTDPASYVQQIFKLADCGPAGAAERIGEQFRSTRVNPAKSQALQAAVRLANRYFSRTQLANYGPVNFANTRYGLYRYGRWLNEWRALDSGIAQRRREQIASRVGDFYAAGNTELAATTGLDLAGLGYATASVASRS